VMISMMKRLQPMDNWHLSQVLIQNSPLSMAVWTYIDSEEPLPYYFLSLVKQYDEGMSVKQLLENEIVLRQQEMNFTKRLLVDSLASDSLALDRVSTLDALLTADSLGDGARGRYLLALLNHKFSTAAQVRPAVANMKGTEGLLAWGDLMTATQGDWHATTTAGRTELWQLAMDQAPSGGGLAWATLLHLGELDSIPHPEIPGMFKSLPMHFERGSAERGVQPLIGVLPNPARDRVAFTVPPGMQEGHLELYDPQGRLLRTISLSAGTGLVEADVQDLAPGLYTISLVLAQHRLDTAKLTIVE